PMLVASALVAALGLRGDAPDRLAAAIDFLNRRRILVVIDNCEHVLPAVALLAGRLGLNCMSRILATSRMPLGTATEQIVWLEPLEAPPAGISLTTQTVTLYPAVQLLLQRSFDWSGYELIDEDCSAIAELCRRLDGIPLAIELAAGKLGQHSARELLELLGEHLEVLKRDEDGIPPRQQTLRATVDWSYRLLTRDEAAMFEVVSVFAGSFDATDAAVAAAAIGLGPAEAAASLGSLVSKSLVSATADRQELSYRLLDTTRQYALDRLKQHSRRRMVFMAHAERMVDLFERSEREWEWREAPEWAAFYQVRLPDLRKALAWSFDEEGDVQLGIRLAIAAIPVLFEISAISEARRIAETALCLEVSDVQRMKLSSSRAWSMLYGRGRELESEGAWHAAIDAAKRCGNADYHLRSLLGYCFYLNGSGQLPRALERLVEFRELARHNPQSPSAADGERFFALVSGYLGDVREAKRILDRLALNAPNLGQRSRMAGFQVDRYIGTRNYLSFISWLAGDPAYAARMAEEGINAAGQLDHLVSQSNVLAISGLPVAFWNGDEKVFAAYTAKLQANLEIEGTELWKPLLQWYRALLPEMRGGSADVETMLDVTTELIETHFTIRIGFYLGVLAETLASHGRLDEANVQLKKAFDYQDRQSERWCLPELRRIQASISRRRGNMHEAESLLGMALEEAHAIGAASFELRAATDLASLQLEANQPCKAAQLLMPIHRRFSENTVTKDLVAATEILHRASHMG
ncbi:MAG: transcriptional regulator, partial [Rhizobiaceae bacterium]|nr:transcriptional regulator [Rhizobiaceae bacterium]